MNKLTYHLLISVCASLVIHSIFIMTFSQQGIIMNRRLSEAHGRIQEIEQQIIELRERPFEDDEIREYQRELLELHREAHQLSRQPVVGFNAHGAGMALGVGTGCTVLYILRRKERKKHQ